jgi:hypothetical protein
VRAPLLRIAIGLPIALLAFVVFIVYLLIEARRPAPQERPSAEIRAKA